MKSVVVVGGGASGITAALTAKMRGLDVTLIEALPHLGGRLGSFTTGSNGQTFDYGQHLLLSNYIETLKLLKLLDCADLVRFQKNLQVPFFHPAKGYSLLKAKPLPPPLNFLAGLTNFTLLSVPDKVRLTLRLEQLLGENLPAGMNAHDWLKGTSDQEYEFFWKPVILSALNCLPQFADIRMVQTVFNQGLLKPGGLGFFTCPLSQIFHHCALKKLSSLKVKLILKCPVARIVIANEKVLKLVSKDHQEIGADYFILALPPQNLLKLNGYEALFPQNHTWFNCLKYSDIYNLHLLFARKIFNIDFGCLLNSIPQWFFHRSWGEGGAYSITISSADAIVADGTDILNLCISDLASCGADLENNPLLFQKVVKNRKATVIISPEFFDYRPGCKTEIENLFLAGDWTDTGLPATIESAVVSGLASAMML